MRHFTGRFAALVLLLSCAAICCCGPHPAAANPAVYEIGDDPGVGFNLISWFNFDNAGTPAVDEGIDEWQGAVQAMYDAGFREVSISPVRYLQHHDLRHRTDFHARAPAHFHRSRRRPRQAARHAGNAQSLRRATGFSELARDVQSARRGRRHLLDRLPELPASASRKLPRLTASKRSPSAPSTTRSTRTPPTMVVGTP